MMPPPCFKIAPGEANLSMAQYLGLPALSAGVLRQLHERAPLAAWNASWLNPNAPREYSTEMDAGTIAHEILLCGSEDCVEVINPEDHPNKDGKGFAKGWTNESIKAARDAARAAGKAPCLPAEMGEIRRRVDAGHAFIESLRTTEPAIWRMFQRGRGARELTMVWDDGDGTMCRIRPDNISDERDVIVDLKFTTRSAEPNAWGRGHLFNMGYNFNSAFYRRGVRALHDRTATYVFLVIETEAPYLSALVSPDPMAIAMADAQVERALRTWKQCVRADAWPGYANRVAYVDPPSYVVAQEQERSGEEYGDDVGGIPYDVSKLFKKSEA